MGISSEGLSAEYQEPIGPAGVRLRDRPRTALQDGQVAIAIRAASLNHLDLWMAHGAQRIEPPRVICADGAGVVEESTGGRWKAGDEVVLLPTVSDGTCEACRAGQEVYCPHFGILGEHTDGTACTRLQVPERMVYPKPAGLSWEEAAAFPLTFLTAWRMLTTRAHLQPGETLLVVGAGAGVGVAAILIGRFLGARVFATSRSESKQEQARKLGAQEAFGTEGLSNTVRELTDKQGVDVIFDSVGAATIDEDLKAVRMGGRIVTCGSTSGPKVTILWPRLFFRHADILGSTMGNASEFDGVLEMLGQGVKPVVDSVFPLAEVESALAHLDSAEQFGKVVLRVSE
ncbi:MAG TPA: zinc-binding dehydrogenase [Candidatus Dormibacteraeota bacterium]|nr:zinc-binding dehydrogenase [Candidatus Dormibacteraeota bacterium]